ncbi:hypothetical protein M569_03817 [Genlisea aurea]|uniref:Phospholipase A1 n=1 Tax=Genlisea aurea TaxID=192259 RepID=S8CVU2_9LAMI|nr:hypothetical protein M569_03817 [Genlisea aurea]
MTPTTNNIPQRWKSLSGDGNWRSLLDPLDVDLQQYIIHYGAMAQATYDNFNSDPVSRNAGCNIHSKSNMFSSVGLDKGNPFKYRVTKYIYATSSIALPLSFLCKSLSEKAWSKESNWIGYVAVATDEGKVALGRRDVVVAWRGTIMPMEWVNDLEFPLVPASELFGESGVANVHQGFLSLYTSTNESVSVSRTSARDQVLSEVRKQVDLHQDEEISITVVGHSLGGSLSTLNAMDITYNGVNKPSSREKGCPVAAFAFACPRSGDINFRSVMRSLHDLHILRISNATDIVPRIPPFLYVDVGVELTVDSTKSKFLKVFSDFSNHHNLEVAYLHPLAIANGDEDIRRDIALANKNSDALRSKYLIKTNWWCQQNHGMVQQEDGSWKLEDHEHDDDEYP